MYSPGEGQGCCTPQAWSWEKWAVAGKEGMELGVSGSEVLLQQPHSKGCREMRGMAAAVSRGLWGEVGGRHWAKLEARWCGGRE